MSDYVLFLRGINVGGKNKVAMPRLREVLSGVGGRDVRTWLATGNVRLDFDGGTDELTRVAERAISDAFGYDAHVIVRDADALRGIVEEWPFTPDDAHHRYVVFGGAQAYDEGVEALRKTPADEHLAVRGDDLYWRTLKGASTTSPVAKVLAKARYKTSTTTRNLNTLASML